ncbi:uncharacterized protein Z518_00156 [Rhinocladiella mackenziei CBS 650.93]|uniref:Uncharacterized protein n=1 Tax=Rhinocladiella mackenziei CBS 650.93 TaxID=1442369 RepID=A0A0D2HEN9_9EURO|nr:uncharacterized protein Z518_00156 [Rhinocladiella mackenziei CBS 650.93]KIX09078.1 hypothetical protein Z518_00156 [Rhinocladiella mackenziei CBS 650.93]
MATTVVPIFGPADVSLASHPPYVDSATQIKVSSMILPSPLAIASSAWSGPPAPLSPFGGPAATSVTSAWSGSISTRCTMGSQLTTFVSSTLSALSTSLSAPSTLASPGDVTTVESVLPSSTGSESTNINMTVAAIPEPKGISEAQKIAAIVAPIFVFFIVLVASGWWFIRRRTERKRTDSLAKRALWTHPECIEGAKAKTMCCDPNKVSLNGTRDSPGGTRDGIGDGITVNKTRARNQPGDRAVGISITKDMTPPIIPQRVSSRFSQLVSLPTNPPDPAPADLDDPAFEIPSSGQISPASTVIISRARQADVQPFEPVSPTSAIVVSGASATDPERSEAVVEALAAWANPDLDRERGQRDSPTAAIDTYFSSSSDDSVDGDNNRNLKTGTNKRDDSPVSVVSRPLSQVVRRRGGLEILRK